ncbi:MAG: amidohydrolase family protein, partial [Acidimicrobiales bacterium]
RFPNLHVLIAEQGTVWLPYILRKLDHAHAMGRGAKWGKLDRRPREVFRDHFIVPPFPEENVQRVVQEVGIEPIVFGSDFPHGEGLAYPRQYVGAQLSGMSDSDVSAIMRDNLARFLNLQPTP